jgi:hypothetical protein
LADVVPREHQDAAVISLATPDRLQRNPKHLL